MAKVAIVFLIGLGLGYSYGYHQAEAGKPSVLQRVMEKFGASRIREQQERREQATDAITR